VPAARPAVLLILPLLALAGCGGGGGSSDEGATATATVVETVTQTTETQTTDTQTQTTQTQTTTTHDESGGAKVVHVSTFRSPTGNIGCVAFGGGVRCDIRDRDWSPPPAPASCMLDYGQGLSVGRAGRGSLVCAGDTTLNPQAKALAYGTASRNGDVICVSREEGMACTNPDGHGFFLSRQRYRAF
jgi:Family of unknown function (DUF6636)